DNLERSMSEYLIREIGATANITVRLRTAVTDGHGAGQLEALTLQDRRDGRTEQVPAAALFVLIGGEPRTQWLPETVQRRWGYVLTGRDVVRDGPDPSRWPLDRAPLPLETSIPGVFAVGDARYRSIKRVASAVGDGATAVRLVHEYLDPKAEDEPELAPEPADESALAAGGRQEGAAGGGPEGNGQAGCFSASSSASAGVRPRGRGREASPNRLVRRWIRRRRRPGAGLVHLPGGGEIGRPRGACIDHDHHPDPQQ